jgi:hypothetical protein
MPTPTPKTGSERIAAERLRQITKEGFDSEHDDEHQYGELAAAACCYAAPVLLYKKQDYTDGAIRFSDPWPVEWDRHWDNRPLQRNRDDLKDPYTLSPSIRIKLLTKAGALIAAEIDRLLRLQQK